tara:strand:- start:684 stop:1652 length:969 start_codon:yes stop_codon:yes gene_type:complete
LNKRKAVRLGFTLTEILVAMSVLAFALVPLMGVMWSGVKRTDISDSYANATTIGASVLEFLLNDSVRFDQLNFTNPLATNLRDSEDSKESYGIVTDVAGTNDFLGQYCADTDPASGCEAAEGTSGSCCQKYDSKQRYFKIGRENYHTDLYIGAYFASTSLHPTKVTSMTYNYMENPAIDYEEAPNNPQQFYDTLALADKAYKNDSGSTDFQHFSPYNITNGVWDLDLSTSGAYRKKVDNQVSLPIYSGTETPLAFDSLGGLGTLANYSNFAKIQLFIRWGLSYVANQSGVTPVTDEVRVTQQIDSRGKAKMIQLVTFKGRFD